MKEQIQKLNVKRILIVYIVFYAVFGIIYSSLTTQAPFGEFDEYTLMTASLLNDGNFSITQDDLGYAKIIFPEVKAGYASSVKLSGYFANDGGELSYYAPTYSIACLPIVQILLWLGLPAIYGYAYSNVLFVCLLALAVIFFAKVDNFKKILLTLVITVNPIIFYYTWQSAEVFMYAALGMAVFAWINKHYKIGGIFVSLVGSLNPTAMVVGIFMILDYFLELFFKNKNEVFKERIIRIVKNWKDIFLYALTFFIALIPFAYNIYYSGSISLPASRGKAYSVDVFAYFRAYLFDWNFGMLPYFTLLLVLFFMLFCVAFIKRNRRFLLIACSFLCTILAYSFMKHINCGMSGIARYNAWSSVVMLFAVVYFYDEILVRNVLCKIGKLFQIISVLILGIIVFSYGPMRASNTSDISMTPIAKSILSNVPGLYNPLPSTFNTRVNRTGGGYDYITPIIYTDDDGYIRKMLISDKDVDTIIKELAGDEEAKRWFEDEVRGITQEAYISIPAKYDLRLLSIYELDTEIYFASDKKNADPYVKKGLSHNEGTYAWTDGKQLVIGFKVFNYEKYDYLHACFDVGGVYNGSQTVSILVNGNEIQEGICTGGKIEFDFQLENTEDVIIHLLLPDAISPAELGESVDNRDLALQLQKFVLSGRYLHEPLAVNEKIYFSSDHYNATNYVQTGMFDKESLYSWTSGYEMKMTFKVCDIENGANLRAKYELAGVYNNNQKTIVYVNDVCVFDEVVNGGSIEFEFKAPADGVINIRMELPEAVSPLELGQSSDARKLALAIMSFQVMPTD